jgi:hypothetical protein
MWDKTFGGPIEDVGYCVQQTTDGGYIIAGQSNSTLHDGGDVWLIKTDSNGNKEWDKTIGGTSNDIGRCVQQTSDGGYIITGFTCSFGVGCDVWLIKTDSNGNKEWDKTFGGTREDEGYYVQQTSDGGYIITGDTFKFEEYDWAILLIKTDNAGNMMWNKVFYDWPWNEGRCVQQTTDGGFIITGFTGRYDRRYVWLIKTNNTGNKEWDRVIGDDAKGYCVRQTKDDGYIISGYKESGFGFSFLYLIKTDNNGKIEWENTIGRPKAEDGYCIQQTTDDGYIITGASLNNNVFLMKTDKDGNIKSKPVTGNMLLLRILERFPLLREVISWLKAR